MIYGAGLPDQIPSRVTSKAMLGELENTIYHDQERVRAWGRGGKKGGEWEGKTIAEQTRTGGEELRKAHKV